MSWKKEYAVLQVDTRQRRNIFGFQLGGYICSLRAEQENSNMHLESESIQIGASVPTSIKLRE